MNCLKKGPFLGGGGGGVIKEKQPGVLEGVWKKVMKKRENNTLLFNLRFSEVQKIWQKKQCNQQIFATSKFSGKYLQYTL